MDKLVRLFKNKGEKVNNPLHNIMNENSSDIINRSVLDDPGKPGTIGWAFRSSI